MPVLVNPITDGILSSIPSRELRERFDENIVKLAEDVSQKFKGNTLKVLADSIYFALSPPPKIELCPHPPSYDQLGVLHRIPADSRAGLNDHSLFAHSCLVSVLSACVGYRAGLDLNLLRTAALLHDLGKLYHRKEYLAKSAEAAAKIMDVTLPEHRDSVARLVTYGVGGGPAEAEGEVLRYAEEMSSKAERELKLKLFGEAVDEDDPKYVEKSRENVLQFYSRPMISEPIEPMEESKAEVIMFSADARAIGQYVESTRTLPLMRGGSFLIKKATEEMRKRITESFGPEFVVYCGGGNLQALLPPLGRDELEKLEQEFRSIFTSIGSDIVCEWAGFQIENICGRFYGCRAELAKRLNKKKREIIESYEINPSEPSCEWCGRPAGEEIWEGGEKKLVCRGCREKYRQGKEAAHSQRKVIADALSMSLEIPRDLDELTKTETDHSDLAVIRGDANMLGRFFGRALSPAHLSFMSWYVEYETYRAVWKAMEAVKEKTEGAAKREYFPFDIVYVGGDDILCLVSAERLFESLQEMASSLERSFERPGGKKELTYGFSVVVCPYKYPLYEACSLSKALLDRCKKKARGDFSKTWVWIERVESAPLAESDIEILKGRSTAKIKPESLTSKPLALEEILEICRSSGRLDISRSSLYKLLELCLRERPSVYPFIRNQVGRGVFSVDDARLIQKYIEEGKVLDFMEIYELSRGSG